ncbi:hypothetical protein TNCV_3331801 [Trichonephila clavipes]|nr:hypothetical protein TNCV_3331801 [Trichonephila clavipes]
MDISAPFLGTELKDELKECVTRFFQPEKFRSCYERIGLKSRNFKDAVDEVCLFDDPTVPAVKYRDCKNELNEVILASTKGGSKPYNHADIFLEYCLNLRVSIFLSCPFPLSPYGMLLEIS